MKFMLKASACAIALAAFAPATASAQAFFSNFEGLANGPTAGNFVQVQTAEMWTRGTGPSNQVGLIEMQNNVAGAGTPAPGVGGAVFVELDSNTNSSMYRVLNTAGVFSLSYLYSPRPNVGSGSNGIEVYLNNTLLPPGLVTGGPVGATTWSTINAGTFSVAVGDVLSFRAAGTSDSLGGYIDNISFAAVPEPASWAMMIGGFGLIGGAMRRRKTATLATA